MRKSHSFAAILSGLTLAVGAGIACGGSDGETGPAGAAGAAGPAGAAGAAGPAGPAGTNGTSVTAGDGGAPLFVSLSDRARRGMEVSPVPLNLAGKTAAQIEQIGMGSYLVNAVAVCGDCHTPSPDKYLAGGIVFPLAPPTVVVSRNLTPDPATGLKDTEAQWIQASRNGTDILNGNQALLVHPWEAYRWMSTADLKAIYAFLKVIPPVTNAYPADVKSGVQGTAFPGNYNEGEEERPLPPETDMFGGAVLDPDDVLRGLAIVPLKHTAPTDPGELTQFGRGSYLVNAVAHCGGCHTNPPREMNAKLSISLANYMTGGFVFPLPDPLPALTRVKRSMSANLLGKNNGYFVRNSYSNFLQTLTRGIHVDTLSADGAVARPLAPPMSRLFANMTPADLQSIYTYMRDLGTTETLQDKVTQTAARYCTSSADCIGALGETCNTTANECVGRVCSNVDQCDVCQTCAGTCAAPAPNAECLFVGRRN